MSEAKSFTIFELIKHQCQQTGKKFVTDRCKTCQAGIGYIYQEETFYYDSICNCEGKGTIEKRSHTEVLNFIRDNHHLLKELTNKNSVLLS